MLQSVSYYQWTEDELTLCRTAAGHLATAIENLRHVERLSGIAFRDGLTGLYNRHFLEERLRVELANAQEQKAALSLAILDIDHFKQINDTFGHAAGDSVLLNLASLLKQSSYPSCFVARWGGEEFVAVFPGFDLGAAVLVMEKLRAKISEVVKIERQDVTISVGVAEADLTTSAPLAQIESDLFATADARLYSAKQRGRNRIVSEGPSPNINELPKDSDEMRSEG